LSHEHLPSLPHQNDCHSPGFAQSSQQQSFEFQQKAAEKKSTSAKPAKYEWLLKKDNRYLCAVCMKTGIANKQGKGAWVTLPLIIKTFSQLYKKSR